MSRFLFLLLLVTSSLACRKEALSPSPIQVTHGTFTDPRDYQVYQTVSIKKQTWMAENLAYIPYVSKGSEQGGIWVYGYEGNLVDSAISNPNYQLYGCLYDWKTASDACPPGWHLPDKKDWDQFIDAIQDEGHEYSVGDALKSVTGWISGTGMDAFGFHALPAGSRGTDGSFYYIGGMTSFWSSTEIDENQAWVRRLDHTRHDLVRQSHDKRIGFTVRCIAD